jgi:membrane protein DedA with SNARE-associated domain
VNIVLVCAVVVTAAILGNSVGYLIGDHFGVRLLEIRILKKRRSTFERALDSIENRGVIFVFIGRFTAILRAIMPALAGMSEMSWKRFQIANVASAASWGVAFSLLGYFAGHELTRVEGDATWVAAGVFAFVVIFVLVHHFVSRRREKSRTQQWRTERDGSAS